MNTTALCWFFVYLLIEVKRNWYLTCDAPLHAFVGAVALLGLAISLVDFLHDVFKARRRRLHHPHFRCHRRRCRRCCHCHRHRLSNRRRRRRCP